MALDLDINDDIVDLMTQTVTIMGLADPQTLDANFAPKEQFTVTVESNVDCLIIIRSHRIEMRGGQQMAIGVGTIIFDTFHELGPTRRIVYVDPTMGVTRYFRSADIRNPGEVNEVFLANVEEVY